VKTHKTLTVGAYRVVSRADTIHTRVGWRVTRMKK